MFTAAAYHKAGNILQKNKRNFFLIAVHNKTRSFIGTVIVNNAAHLHFAFFVFYNQALIGNNANCPAINSCITAYNCFTIFFFKLFKTESASTMHSIISTISYGFVLF